MHGEASRKVPDGKLVKVETEYSEVFEKVDIRGDFFLEPPQALDALESAVEGLSVDYSREEIISKMNFVDADLIGFSRGDIADALLEAAGKR